MINPFAFDVLLTEHFETSLGVKEGRRLSSVWKRLQYGERQVAQPRLGVGNVTLGTGIADLGYEPTKLIERSLDPHTVDAGLPHWHPEHRMKVSGVHMAVWVLHVLGVVPVGVVSDCPSPTAGSVCASVIVFRRVPIDVAVGAIPIREIDPFRRAARLN
jgi:hypothetical protein